MNKLFIFLIGLILCSKAEAQSSALSLADSLYQVGNYSHSIKVYQQIDPQTGIIQQKIANAFKAKGNLEEAMLYYERAISNNPKLIIAASNYGKLLYATYHFKQADSVFTRLTKNYPSNAEFHYQLGKIKKARKDTLYVQEFSTAVHIDSTHQKALYQLALRAFNKKEYAKVEQLGNKALSFYANNIQMKSLLAQNAYAEKAYEMAKNRFKEVANLMHTENEFIVEKMGWCYYYLGNYDAALHQFEKAFQLNPENADAYLNAGKICNLLAAYKKGEKYLLMALLLSKNSVDEQYQSLALNYKHQGDYKKAIGYFKDALAENPKKMRSQYELAVCADNYYKDYQTKINYYQLFLNRFKQATTAKEFVYLAQQRITDLKKEQHLTGEEK